MDITNRIFKAIGSGQLLGKGYNHGEVYIPENHTDFIFSVIGKMGFIGSVLLILLFLFLIFHLIRLASKIDSQFNKVFIIGYVSLIVFHVLQNIGMTVQLLPITGIPLPFISYGGSSLWSLMTGIGVVLSIYYHEPQRYEITTLSKNLIQFNLYKIRDTIHDEQCLSLYINLDNQHIKYYIIMQIILIHDLLD